MLAITPGTVLGGKYRILDYGCAGGQSIGYTAEPLQPNPSEPWRSQLWVKQFTDVVPGSPLATRIPEHYTVIRSRLKEATNRIVLPDDLFESHDSLLAVYPLLKGKTLEDRLTSLTHAERVRCASAICKAVWTLHKNNIAHADLKPANVVTYDRYQGAMRTVFTGLVDLDSAIVDGVGVRSSTVGSAGYYSPEHLTVGSGSLAPNADMFSLGIVLAELLFGLHPFAGADDYDRAIQDGTFVLRAGGIHRSIVALVRRCLSRDPAKRPRAVDLSQAIFTHFAGKGPDLPLVASAPDQHFAPRTIGAPRRPTLVELKIDGRPFRRYTATQPLSPLELRGSGAAITRTPVTLTQGGDGWWVSVEERGAVRWAGIELAPGDHLRVGGPTDLQVGGVHFMVGTAPVAA